MNKLIIIGNSGSGKTSISKKYVDEFSAAHLDLDVLAWENSVPPVRRVISESAIEIEAFLKMNESWVIEGCYADLVALAIPEATNLVFLCPGVEACVENCRIRPWEPHKYSSLKEQNENLDLLLEWVKQYEARSDEFSLVSHQALFDGFVGQKVKYTELSQYYSIK